MQATIVRPFSAAVIIAAASAGGELLQTGDKEKNTEKFAPTSRPTKEAPEQRTEKKENTSEGSGKTLRNLSTV